MNHILVHSEVLQLRVLVDAYVPHQPTGRLHTLAFILYHIINIYIPQFPHRLPPPSVTRQFFHVWASLFPCSVQYRFCVSPHMFSSCSGSLRIGRRIRVSLTLHFLFLSSTKVGPHALKGGGSTFSGGAVM